MSVSKIHIIYRKINVICVVFTCCCLFSFQLRKHSTTFWTSIFVCKAQTFRGFADICASKVDVCIDNICRHTGGMTKRPKCITLCSACQRFHPASSTYCAKEQTQTGACLWLNVHKSNSVQYFMHIHPNVLCVCLCRHIPNSVVSVDLSHHLDNADDDNAAAQWVPLQNTPTSWFVKIFWLPTVTVTLKFCFVFSCLDARFYDDEMLTVVLQRVEEDNWRVLAQLPLASTLSCESEFNWEPNLRCVCVTIRNAYILELSKCFLQINLTQSCQYAQIKYPLISFAS